MKTTQWLKGTGVILMALQMVACGDPFNRTSDPLTNYPDLKQDVPPSQYKAPDQEFDGVLFDIQVEGRDGSRQLDFYEGKSTSYTIKSRVFVPGASYSLKAHGLPAGASFTDGKTGDGTWTLTWTPGIGTIPNGISRQTFDLKIELVLESNSTARAQEVFRSERRNRLKGFALTVNFPESQPSLSIKGLDKKEFKRGEVIPVRIEVKDANSSKERRPDLVVTFDRSNQTNEAKTYPLTMALIPDPAKADQYVGKGTWVFHYYFDTTTIPEKYIDANAKYDSGEVVVYAINPSTRLDSNREMKRIKVSPSATGSTSPDGSRPLKE